MSPNQRREPLPMPSNEATRGTAGFANQKSVFTPPLVSGALLFLLLCASITQAEAGTLRSGAPSPRELQRILDQAFSGDTIILRTGVWRVSDVHIVKPLVLLAQDSCILDAEHRGGSILHVESDSVTIAGLSFRNVQRSDVSDNAAIKVWSRSRVVIRECRIRNAFFAIYLSKSSHCQVLRNDIEGSFGLETESGNGIHAWSCREILVEGNRVSGHRDGIYFEFMRQGRVVANHSSRHVRYGLHFMFSDSCSYIGNTFTANGAGVAVMYTHWVEMAGNTFSNNWGPAAYGILLKEITDCHLYNNLFESNSVAIHGESASRMLLENNSFVSNGFALRLIGGCENATIARNNFDGNTFDVSSNERSGLNYFHQNYWSDYQGYDLNRDGIGDKVHYPVRLYSLMVAQMPSTLILMRTIFVAILDLIERVLPSLTPSAVVDRHPSMKPIASRYD